MYSDMEKGTEATSNSEKIKPVAFTIVEVLSLKAPGS